MSINKRINEVIETLKTSKNKFGEKAKISSALISKITTREQNFGVDVLKKIVLTHQVSPFFLLFGTGDMFLSDSPNDYRQFGPNNLTDALFAIEALERMAFKIKAVTAAEHGLTPFQLDKIIAATVSSNIVSTAANLTIHTHQPGGTLKLKTGHE